VFGASNLEWVEADLLKCEGGLDAFEAVRKADWHPDLHHRLRAEPEIIMHQLPRLGAGGRRPGGGTRADRGARQMLDPVKVAEAMGERPGHSLIFTVSPCLPAAISAGVKGRRIHFFAA
jgi:hypothetical protein